MMNKGPCHPGHKRLHSSSMPQFSPPPGMSIAIQNNSSYSSIFDKLPKITLTIKQASDCKSYASDKTKTRLSQSYDSFPQPTQIKLQRGLTSFEHSMKARHSQESDDHKAAEKEKTEKQGSVDLHRLSRMSRSQMTKEWVHKSPLGAERMENEEEVKVKPQRKVRFGGGDWIYRDSSFVFE